VPKPAGNEDYRQKRCSPPRVLRTLSSSHSRTRRLGGGRDARRCGQKANRESGSKIRENDAALPAEDRELRKSLPDFRKNGIRLRTSITCARSRSFWSLRKKGIDRTFERFDPKTLRKRVTTAQSANSAPKTRKPAQIRTRGDKAWVEIASVSPRTLTPKQAHGGRRGHASYKLVFRY
jgi:hypothetical protein